MATYFEALGIDPKDATPAKAKEAYRKLAQDGAHPDKGGDPEKFKLLTAAYNALSTEDGIRTARYGFGDKAYGPWKKQWEALNGPSFTRSGAQSVMDDLEQMVRDMEARRAAARRQDAAAKARAADARERAERDAQERAERRRAQQRDANAAGPKQPNEKPFAGSCGAATKSGPCVRPEGHTPNGHMSQKVKDQKYENYKRRQGRM